MDFDSIGSKRVFTNYEPRLFSSTPKFVDFIEHLCFEYNVNNKIVTLCALNTMICNLIKYRSVHKVIPTKAKMRPVLSGLQEKGILAIHSIGYYTSALTINTSFYLHFLKCTIKKRDYTPSEKYKIKKRIEQNGVEQLLNDIYEREYPD